jgi:hypothetical protein
MGRTQIDAFLCVVAFLLLALWLALALAYLCYLSISLLLCMHAYVLAYKGTTCVRVHVKAQETLVSLIICMYMHGGAVHVCRVWLGVAHPLPPRSPRAAPAAAASSGAPQAV